jgi:hypothetical protein
MGCGASAADRREDDDPPVTQADLALYHDCDELKSMTDGGSITDEPSRLSAYVRLQSKTLFARVINGANDRDDHSDDDHGTEGECDSAASPDVRRNVASWQQEVTRCAQGHSPASKLCIPLDLAPVLERTESTVTKSSIVLPTDTARSEE